MWIAICSISMMFAGFTSAVIVRQAQGNWVDLKLSNWFFVSTAVIIASSVTMQLILRSFKQRNMRLHKQLVVLTMILGLLFGLFQYLGFHQMLEGSYWNNNVSMQFILAIVVVHALHVFGGIVALAIMFGRTFNRKVKKYSLTGLELISTYWHFVDILWIYLLLFFLFIH